ncbi:hypothetical protein SY86_22190 [Erwinia tracheiphila]|uniref:4-hydroxythreonine-4-phosphate dehydrogenase n=1 Tax=Erwinia tracheiphila TaxID=65700 RepID=A0A0M2KJK5_9GAMM|nr:4-hydroxythreonine-4-phosphate dehydrogenase 2 [Erwinia tracheiphila PSU-1]KKF37487.1 hypothetical protein SY86_22190 [Erwinia tracheiphila]
MVTPARKLKPRYWQVAPRQRWWSQPCPPDTVFLQCHEGQYDMVVAMYHDQGHIPLKLQGFYDGVNITAGLPFIHTSADHGTAFDIAWTGKAKSESMAISIQSGIGTHERTTSP